MANINNDKKLKIVSISMTCDEYNQLKEQAQKDDRTISNYIRIKLFKKNS